MLMVIQKQQLIWTSRSLSQMSVTATSQASHFQIIYVPDTAYD
nr:MAG TPA: hypothetical protein [Caudoviricetes sp.]